MAKVVVNTMVEDGMVLIFATICMFGYNFYSQAIDEMVAVVAILFSVT